MKKKPKKVGYSIWTDGIYEDEHGELMDTEPQRVRGPYKHAETAGAVREELENLFPDKTWNLQIREEEIEETA